MARTAFDIPSQTPKNQGIVNDAAAEVGAIMSCAGSAEPGCLVVLNLLASLAASAVVDALIDPLIPILPLGMSLAPNANLTFQIFGPKGKTSNAEGDGITDVYTPGDFSLARMRAGINILPMTGSVTKERPLRLHITNAAITTQVTRGQMIGIATDRNGRVPEEALRFYLSMFGNGRPEVISLCAKGYHCVGGYAEQPSDWCAGFFPPGYLAPVKMTQRTLVALTPQVVGFGPLQPMVPVFCDILTAAADVTFEVRDPETRKQAGIDGGEPLAAAAPTGARGSMISPTYNAADFLPITLESGFNPLPWTQLGCATKERPFELNATSVGGTTMDMVALAQILGKNNEINPNDRIYAQRQFGGWPAIP